MTPSAQTSQESTPVLKHSAVQLAKMLRSPNWFLNLIPKLFQAEVSELCGSRRKHTTTHNQRWGTNPGSVHWNGTKVPVRVPRIRNTSTNKEVPLETYRILHDPEPGYEEKLTLSVLYGLSQRKYGQVAKELAEGFGLSGSTTGRVFIQETAKALEQFMNRSFEGMEFVAILIDGKTLRKEQILLVVGLTRKGEKVILGFIEAQSEAHECVVALLQDLQERGFRAPDTLLVLLDGSKGLHKGVRKVFGDKALIQRCQWHKRENVISKISDPDLSKKVKHQMEAAYAKNTYGEAKRALNAIIATLDLRCPAAANSLREGLEPTLTLHKLGIPKPLRDRLRTTNIIESINSRLAHATRRVTRWSNSDQRQRWLAATCLDIEKHSLNPIPQDQQWDCLLRALKRHQKQKNQDLNHNPNHP